MTKIILDTDIGYDCDDAFALALLLNSPDTDVLTVITTHGDVAGRARVASTLISHADKEVPVGIGASAPLKRSDILCEVLPNGMSEEERTRPLEKYNIHPDGIGLLIEKVKEHPGEVDIVSICALTTMAQALQREPALEQMVKQHYIMGGLFTYPLEPSASTMYTRGRQAEFNILGDPEAARLVFSSAIPKTVAPIDVTRYTPITEEEITALPDNGLQGRLRAAGLEYLMIMRAFSRAEGPLSTCMHDPLTVALAITDIERKTVSADILVHADGCTEAIPGTKTEIVYDFDRKAYEQIFKERVMK